MVIVRIEQLFCKDLERFAHTGKKFTNGHSLHQQHRDELQGFKTALDSPPLSALKSKALKAAESCPKRTKLKSERAERRYTKRCF